MTQNVAKLSDTPRGRVSVSLPAVVSLLGIAFLSTGCSHSSPPANAPMTDAQFQAQIKHVQSSPVLSADQKERKVSDMQNKKFLPPDAYTNQ